MSEERFTNREIKLMFDSIELKLDEIKNVMRSQHGEHAQEIDSLKNEVDGLKSQVTTWKAYIAAIGFITGLVGIGPLIELLQKI